MLGGELYSGVSRKAISPQGAGPTISYILFPTFYLPLPCPAQCLANRLAAASSRSALSSHPMQASVSDCP